MKPHSPPAERNREPILAALRPYLGDRRHALEIGSGTGQHAVYFAGALPWLQWQASDHVEALAGIEAWRSEADLPNLPPPLAMQAQAGAGLQPPPPLPRDTDGVTGFDLVYTANTLHIMGWSHVQALFAALPAITRADALLAVYGPFNVGGHYTSDSNREFDRWLASTYPEGGLRDLEAVQALAEAAGFTQIASFAMPANNLCLLWRRGGPRLGQQDAG